MSQTPYLKQALRLAFPHITFTITDNGDGTSNVSYETRSDEEMRRISTFITAHDSGFASGVQSAGGKITAWDTRHSAEPAGTSPDPSASP